MVVENQINLGIVEHDISITVKIPNGKMLVLVSFVMFKALWISEAINALSFI